MKKRMIMLICTVLSGATLWGQNVVPRCRTCGKEMTACEYQGRHPMSATKGQAMSQQSTTRKLSTRRYKGYDETLDKETITVGTVSFNMVFVDGGSFMMGATEEQGNNVGNDERPIHRVTIDSYRICETPVTQVLWKEIMGDNPSKHKGKDLPVEQVSYDDVKVFIQKLNERTGLTFRLPTEAEWEYAARGGRYSKGYRYSGGNDIGAVAWYNGNSGSTTHKVGQKAPNELGLYDMSGNVYEWCDDLYGPYSVDEQNNPTGAGGGGALRVLRGGSWLNLANGCRSTYRDVFTSNYRNANVGFRLVLTNQEQKVIEKE